VLLLTTPMATLMVVREWRSADVAGLLPILGGRVLGTLGGVGLLALVPSGFLSVLFGALVLASLLRLKVSLNYRTRFAGAWYRG
jgi:uncharacterized membrane protein YfcA